MATCIDCRCVDERACPGGCSWLALDQNRDQGVCSQCPGSLPEFKSRFRIYKPDYSAHGPQRIGEAFELLIANRLLAVSRRVAPGLFKVRIVNLDQPTEHQVRVREEFVDEELFDVMLAKYTEARA